MMDEMDWACGMHGRHVSCILRWGGGLRERGYLEDLGIKGMILLKLNFKKWYWEAWTGVICTRIGAFCGDM